MTHRVDTPAVSHDEARMELCHTLAKAIREGEVGMQIRFVHSGDTITAAWIYTKTLHEWRKRDDLEVQPRLVDQIFDVLEGLFSQEFTDAWTHHRIDHVDRTDFELKFHRDAIAGHINGNLESYLNGCLSHAHHDSGKDSRRRMGFRGK